MTGKFEDSCVISGLGQSTIGRRQNKSALRLTTEACVNAIADAGLTRADIDGLVTWPGEVGYTGGLTGTQPGFSGPSAPSVKEALGLAVNWYSAGPEGPAMFGAVMQAAMAVAAGLCRHVLVYRTMTEAQEQGSGRRQGIGNDDAGVSGYLQWMLPYGSMSGSCWMAIYATRYFHVFGAGREDLAAISLNARRNAARNPHAMLQTPLELEDYLAARMITTPLCLLDCDIPVDGSTAVIVSAAEYAADLPHPAVRIEAVGSALRGRASWDQWDDLTSMGAVDAGAHMWLRTDLKPNDVDVANIYDGFSILSWLWLEGLQLCGRGEAASFATLDRIGRGGALPMATDGGQLSGGRLHGFGHLREACLQLRGEAGERQVEGAEVAVTSAGAGPLAGCLLLTK